MQRKYQFLWLALVPFGAVGALATGMVSLPWQQPSESSKVTVSDKPAATPTPTTASSETKPKSGKLAALGKQAKQSTLPVTKFPTKTSEKSSDPMPSAKKPSKTPVKFGIDIARISDNGSSVLAGYAAPGKPITITVDGKPIGVVTPDEFGDWVLITPHKFATSDPQISFQAGDQPAKMVAALAAKPSTSAKVAQQPTASQVTQQMLQRLKELTKEASAQPAKAKTASSAAGNAPSKPSGNSASAKGGEGAQQAKGAKSALPQQRLALSTKPARLGGPSSKTALPKASETARPSNRKVAAAPIPVLPTALKPGLPTALRITKTSSAANVEKVALPGSIPVPVQFLYRRAVFTDQGRQAATLLLKYFKAKKFNSVSLSGHADERGTPAANKKLSRQRLASIRKFLRAGGFKGRLKLVAKGETEKFAGIDRSKFAPDELYQLDRRVEVMSAR